MNDIVESCHGSFRNIVCYLIGEDDGKNNMHRGADEVIYLNLDNKVVKWRNSQTVQLVVDIINSHRVDFISCHMTRAMPIGVRASMYSSRQPKVVGVFHGVEESPGLGRKLLYLFMFRKMEKIVSVSEGGLQEIKSLFWRVDPGKLLAIPNGLDFTGFLDLPSADRAALFGDRLANRRVFITVSRLAAKKNLSRLIQAFAEMQQTFPESCLVIVGEGREEVALKARVAELGIADSVEFLGYRRDIPDLLKAADVYVIPSLREGLARSLLEAMAVGKPVLASRISGQEEVVTDFKHGRLVDPLNVSEMAKALAYFMQLDAAALRAQGEAAQDHVLENYNREGMMEKYLQLFLELQSRRGLPQAQE